MRPAVRLQEGAAGPCCLAASAIGGGHDLFSIDADFEAIRRHSDLKLVGEQDLA